MAYLGRKGAEAPLTSGDIPDGSISAVKVASDVATQAEIDLKANIASPTFTGTIGGGTLGSAVVFDDAHKDIDVDVDSWDLLIGVVVNYTSETIIDYDWTHKLGSNCTESAGVVTVAKAGWYFVTTVAGQKAQETQRLELYFQISDPAGSAANTSYVKQPGRILIIDPNAGESYGVSAMSWLVYLRATDKCCMNGTGHLYGNTTSTATEQNATNRFLGFRIGA